MTIEYIVHVCKSTRDGTSQYPFHRNSAFNVAVAMFPFAGLSFTQTHFHICYNIQTLLRLYSALCTC